MCAETSKTCQKFATGCGQIKRSRTIKSMSKKSKRSKQKKKFTYTPSQANRLFDLIGHQIFQRNYAEAVINCERLLNYLPRNAPMRADALNQLATAHAMLQNFPQSYE